MGKSLPSSLNSYLDGIREVLPEGCVSSDLEQLEIFRFEKAYPEKGESLSSWMNSAKRNREGKLTLTMVVGETLSDYRKARQPLQKRQQSSGPLLNIAYTCDGTAGARAVIGLLRESRFSLDCLDFDAVIDEWIFKYPEICQRVKESHLIVLGTPEVNIFATILHGLVKDFHYGRDVWPPDLSSTGDKLFVQNAEYLRCPRVHEFNDCGGVFLLRNPWNSDYRVLWIGGLTGIGTWHGSSLVASGWSDYPDMASISAGVVFGRDVLGNDKKVRPRDWLVWNEGELTWESSIRWEPPKAARKHAFLSYCHENAEQVAKLREVLVANKMTVWRDVRIHGGEHLDYAILQAIDDSYAFVVCLSEELISRMESGVYPEIYRAIKIQQKLAPGSIFIIPVRLSDCKIPQFDIGGGRTLGELKYIDLFPQSNWDEGIKQLVAALCEATRQRC